MGAKARVVVTGMGVVSSLGTGEEAVAQALREGRSGIVAMPDWGELGIASQVCGLPETDPESQITTRRIGKSAGPVARMALAASAEALSSGGLDPTAVAGRKIAVLVGSGSGSSLKNHEECNKIEASRTSRRVSPFTVPQVMGSTASANVAVALGVHGESWTVSSACSTGAHAIGLARLLIESGRYEQVLAGAAEEVNWCPAAAFDAMRAISRGFNDRPELASRPFDTARDGFVLSGGAGVLLLESLEHAQARGARIRGEVLGFGASSDGNDMVLPDPRGAATAMRSAIEDAGLTPADIDYVNAHGTSTPAGDPSEAQAMADVFGDAQPLISSTKSMTGHAVGAAGSLEAIYSLMMLERGFIAPSINIENLDESCRHLRLVTTTDTENAPRIALSNSFGFGGTNACLVLGRHGNEEK